jgi:uncharacterized protein (DUF2252 family)
MALQKIQESLKAFRPEEFRTKGSGADWGKSLRDKAPLAAHADWTPPADREDPVSVITGQNADRLQWLVPVRHWRMSQSPFSFYRGAAKVMAMDLVGTPATGIPAQLCGDAHLSNFGMFASPERHLIFDVNDFDETLPGPWEWDLKRLAVSFTIAARHKGYSTKRARKLTKLSTAAYREAMAHFAGMTYLDVWYTQTRVSEIYAYFEDQMTKSEKKQAQKAAEKAQSKDRYHALEKIGEETDDGYQIVSQPPLIKPLRDVEDQDDAEALRKANEESMEGYLHTVNQSLLVLLARFELKDLAIKVVGVGSVGTRCLVVLLQGRHTGEPFFLQVKEAGESVLEAYLPKSTFANPGERVVTGQRIMQSASDSFLGWSDVDSQGTHSYWRQFKDMKGSIDIETAGYDTLKRYAQLCGFTLARSHALSADAAAIAGYLGSGKDFDSALATFGELYADQNERDHQAFVDAIESGRIPAQEG